MQFFQKFLDNFLDSGKFLVKFNVLRLFKIIKIYLLKSHFLDTFYKNFRQFWAKIYMLRH